MSGLTPYKTLMRRAADEFTVNKSRFIGSASPAASEEEALAFLREVRAAHPGANHNCYAYVVGTNMGIMRYSDDGEPGGTAGLPIIEVLRARQVTNACLVVTRYFGGVLLGAGGLLRAYSQGASLAVNAAGVGVMHPTARYLLDVSYPMLGRLEHHLKSQPVAIEDKAFAESITFTLLVRCADEAAFVQSVVSATEGRVEPLRFDEFYRAWPQ